MHENVRQNNMLFHSTTVMNELKNHNISAIEEPLYYHSEKHIESSIL